jgi:hypothetical protein
MDYKMSKPVFMEPLKINVGDPINGSFYMMKNIVYKEKQILALKREEESKTILLVEAKIVNGQLNYISMLSNDLIIEVSKLLEDCMH